MTAAWASSSTSREAHHVPKLSAYAKHPSVLSWRYVTREESAPRFLNVDLELTSRDSLDAIVEAFGRQHIVLRDSREGELNYASFEVGRHSTDPEATIVQLLDLVENLMEGARTQFRNAEARTLNVGFESGIRHPRIEYVIGPSVLNRVARLDCGIAMTVYPAGRKPWLDRFGAFIRRCRYRL